MTASDSITIEVAYATPERQQIITLAVPQGTTAWQAAERSGIAQVFPEIDLASAKMGIFGRMLGERDAAQGYVLEAGDRVEIYRPLTVDPKVSRQRRAAKAREKRG